ncbi:MAG: hypothetical protein AAFV54_16630, partial [Pseudomonadota bacterium]
EIKVVVGIIGIGGLEAVPADCPGLRQGQIVLKVSDLGSAALVCNTGQPTDAVLVTPEDSIIGEVLVLGSCARKPPGSQTCSVVIFICRDNSTRISDGLGALPPENWIV